jgi:hypothetical protein
MDIFDMAFSSGFVVVRKAADVFLSFTGGDAVASHFDSAFRQVRSARDFRLSYSAV